jgi:hypothetical protein
VELCASLVLELKTYSYSFVLNLSVKCEDILFFFKINRSLIANVNKKCCHSGAKLGQSDITQGQAGSTGVPPDQKVNKSEYLNYNQ